MKCTNCGREIDNDSNYCEYCGTKQNITENTPSGFVDLGLPSGTLWKNENEQDFYDYDKVVRTFGNKLPTEEQWEELKNSCQWHWTGDGYNVIGSNGNSIFLPASGRCSFRGIAYDVGIVGYYWSSTPYNSTYAYHCFFNSNDMNMYYDDICNRLSVRLVQD